MQLTTSATVPEGMRLLGKNILIAECPAYWYDEGVRCRKPMSQAASQPFTYVYGDKL